MKRLLIILCGILFSFMVHGGIHHYADYSVLKSGHIGKIRVSETGVYCLPYDTLKAWGFDPSKVRIMGYGGNVLDENFTLPKWDDVPSIPFYMHKGNDGVFGKGDYILFYAQGPMKWQFKGGRWHHIQNPYSQHGYYFISDDAGEQKIMQMVEPLDDINASNVEWFMDYMVHEKDLVNLIDLSGVSGGGREFYGEQLSANMDQLNLTFRIPNVLQDYVTICYAEVAAMAQTPSSFTISLSNSKVSESVAAVKVSDNNTRAEKDSIKLIGKAEKSDEQVVKIKFSNNSEGATGYLNYVELTVA